MDYNQRADQSSRGVGFQPTRLHNRKTFLRSAIIALNSTIFSQNRFHPKMVLKSLG